MPWRSHVSLQLLCPLLVFNYCFTFLICSFAGRVLQISRVCWFLICITCSLIRQNLVKMHEFYVSRSLCVPQTILSPISGSSGELLPAAVLLQSHTSFYHLLISSSLPFPSTSLLFKLLMLFGFSSCLCSLAEGFFASAPFQIYSARREARAYSTHFPSVQKAVELLQALLSPGAFLSSFPEKMEHCPVLSLAPGCRRGNKHSCIDAVCGSWQSKTQFIFSKNLPFSSINNVILYSY